MKTSNYEQNIINLLRRNRIAFEREKTFSDLKGGKFRYDFYLPALNVLIEVDGEQHFHQVKHFQKTRRDFLKQQEHDRRKNSYALAKGITLIRIPYWEIENITVLADLFQDKFIVENRWHSDFLVPPRGRSQI